MNRRRFFASKQSGGNSESYTPPEGVYWDLSKNVGYVPFTPMSDSGKEYFPSLYVEFENALDVNKRGNGGFAYLISGYNSQGNGYWDGIGLDSELYFIAGHQINANSSAVIFNPYWRNANGLQNAHILGGLPKGTWFKNGGVNTSSLATKWNWRFDGYIKFGCKSFGSVFNPVSYPTNASLLADLANINGIEGGECKLRQFIYWSDGTSFTSLEELIANRNTAEVDIRFDAQGNPYNGGTSGELIFTNV